MPDAAAAANLVPAHATVRVRHAKPDGEPRNFYTGQSPGEAIEIAISDWEPLTPDRISRYEWGEVTDALSERKRREAILGLHTAVMILQGKINDATGAKQAAERAYQDESRKRQAVEREISSHHNAKTEAEDRRKGYKKWMIAALSCSTIAVVSLCGLLWYKMSRQKKLLADTCNEIAYAMTQSQGANYANGGQSNPSGRVAPSTEAAAQGTAT